MNDLLEEIPTDLIHIIISYLDYYNLSNLLNAYEFPINWNYMFWLKYPKYYHKNIKEYNIKELYLEFLKLSKLIDERPITLISSNKTFNEYVLLNSIIQLRSPDRYISYLDNVKLFIHFNHKLSDTNLKYYFINESINILTYYLENVNIERNFMEELKELYSEYIISIKVTELIIYYLPWVISKLFKFLYFTDLNYHIFEYLIKKYKLYINFTKLITSENYSNTNFLKFKLIYKHYKFNVLDVYLKLIHEKTYIKDKTEIISFLTFNSDVVQEYLID